MALAFPVWRPPGAGGSLEALGREALYLRNSENPGGLSPGYMRKPSFRQLFQTNQAFFQTTEFPEGSFTMQLKKSLSHTRLTLEMKH